jgi:antitoxin component YwqK of YwqJK toxin-antitoxin module
MINPVTDYYINGTKHLEGNYNDYWYTKNGLFSWFYQNGQISKQATYVLNVLNGKFQTWYSNGEKQEEVNYANGKKVGCDYMWDESGRCLVNNILGGWTYSSRDFYYFDFYENGAIVDRSNLCPCVRRTSQIATREENESYKTFNSNSNLVSSDSIAANDTAKAENDNLDTIIIPSNTNQINSDQKRLNSIYGISDFELLERFVNLEKIEIVSKEYFINEFKHNTIISKSKIRFEQSKEFDDILIGFQQRGNKELTPGRYMYYKGVLFEHIGNFLEVVRKLSDGIGIMLFTVSPPDRPEEIYYKK